MTCPASCPCRIPNAFRTVFSTGDTYDLVRVREDRQGRRVWFRWVER